MTTTSIELNETAADRAVTLKAVSTQALAFNAARAWKKVRFYEHIETPPSLLLRVVLPVPVGTTGCHGRVGDTSRCLYSDGGYLTKRMTRIDEGRSVHFEIVEQSIRYHRFVQLLGGSIRVTPLGEHICQVEMITHYRCTGWAKWLSKNMILRVIKAMHRVVLRDMAVSLGG